MRSIWIEPNIKSENVCMYTAIYQTITSVGNWSSCSRNSWWSCWLTKELQKNGTNGKQIPRRYQSIKFTIHFSRLLVFNRNNLIRIMSFRSSRLYAKTIRIQLIGVSFLYNMTVEWWSGSCYRSSLFPCKASMQF